MNPKPENVLSQTPQTAPSPTVALARCGSYEPAAVAEALAAVLAPLEGLPAFVKAGDAVLLKPNLLTDRRPEEAVTTHPEVIRAVIRAVKDCGGRPTVGDSPSGAAKLARVWEATGVAAVCAEEDVPLISFEKAGSRRFESGDCAFRIARPVLDAAVLINLPKVKTHILTTLTGAVKNLYGAVPGYQKMHLHKAFPSATAFSRLLAAIYRSVPPALHIADGVVGMEGDGPSGGRPVALGFLAAAADGVALDMTLCRLLRVNPVSVPYLAQLAPDEDSRARYARVAVAGTPLEDLAPPGFALPRLTAARLLPRPLIRLVERFFWIRPSFSERCVRCGRCVEACPVQALALPEGCRTAVLAPARCIGCCCCHEICPEGAVTMTPSAVLRLLRRGKERS